MLSKVTYLAYLELSCLFWAWFQSLGCLFLSQLSCKKLHYYCSRLAFGQSSSQRDGGKVQNIRKLFRHSSERLGFKIVPPCRRLTGSHPNPMLAAGSVSWQCVFTQRDSSLDCNVKNRGIAGHKAQAPYHISSSSHTHAGSHPAHAQRRVLAMPLVKSTTVFGYLRQKKIDNLSI